MLESDEPVFCVKGFVLLFWKSSRMMLWNETQHVFDKKGVDERVKVSSAEDALATGSPITPGTPLARVRTFIELARQAGNPRPRRGANSMA